MRRIPFIALAAVLLVVLAMPAAGAPGDLDPRFDGDGIATAFAAGGLATSVAVDHAGRIVAAGYTLDGAVDVGVARFLPNGSLDRRFGTGGKVRLDLGGSDLAFGLAVAPNDGLAVVGRTTTGGADRMFVIRLDANGTRVTTFGTNGVRLVTFGGTRQAATAVAFTPDGRVVVGGYSSNGVSIRSAVARLLPDGRFDTTFDADGRVSLDLSVGAEQVNDLLVLPGGRIVAAGYAEVGGVPAFSLLRLLPTGTLDPSFGTGGVTRTSLGPGPDLGNALALTPDRHLVVVGQAGNGGKDDWGVVRYGFRGRLDPTFGTGGVVVVPFTGSFEEATDVVASGPRLVVVGRIHHAGTGDDVGAIRLTEGGALDATFGTGGVVRVDLHGSTDDARAMARQSNGKVVIAGEGWRDRGPRFLVVRLLAS
jgi:uncharacterized delta-60 repeat protein